MKVFSVYGLRPKNVARINSGELLVEKAGYQPAYKEIAQMIASGDRFQKAREFQYKNEQEIDESVKHVDTYDKDVFEMIDENRKITAQLVSERQAFEEKRRKEAFEKEKEAIIEEYEQSKAPAAAPTKATE